MGLDEKAGLTVGHTATIERGDRANPSAETAAKLAIALGVPVAWLISGGKRPRLISGGKRPQFVRAG
jgi:transcriptional regulator with XRE-family HTH domain